jgi:hypothetical protein
MSRHLAPLLSFLILLVCTLSPSSGLAGPESEIEMQARLERLQQIKAQTRRLRMIKSDKVMWLRGPMLQQVFNDVSRNMDMLKFMTPAQRELLKKEAEVVDQELDRKLEKENGKSAEAIQKPTVVAELTRTYVMLYALAIVAIVKEEVIRSHETDTAYRWGPTGDKLLEAIREIVDSGEVMAGLLGAGATHKALAKPLELLTYLVTDSTVAPLFKTFMIHFTHTLVSFTGFEFAGQLWRESINRLDFQIKDPFERQFLQDRNHLATLLFRFLSPNARVYYPREYRASRKVLGLIIQNAAKIIYLGGDRFQWLYNSIRLRIAKGQFVTLVSSMVAATTVGTSLFPGAGTALGMAFGFVGGTIAVFAPEEQKNLITTKIKDSWLSMLESSSGAGTAAYLKFGFDENGASRLSRLVTRDSIFIDRTTYRERVVDVHLERVYYYHDQIHANDAKIREFLKESAQNPTNEKVKRAIEDLSAKNLENMIQMADSLKSLVSLYLTEAHFFEKLRDSAPESAQEDYDSQVVLSENMLTHFCTFADSILAVDFLNLKARVNQDGTSLSKIKSMCKYEFKESAPFHEKLSAARQDDFDSATRFLDKFYWSKFNEQNVTLDRLDRLYEKRQ